MTTEPTLRPPVPGSMRVQHHGRVRAVLDGDAHLHVWEPNRVGDRIDCDLTDHIALLVTLGLDAPPAPEPHWSDTSGSTVIVSLDPGAHGYLAVDGHRVSCAAAVRLAANGFVHLLRDATEQLDDETEPAEDDGKPASGAGPSEPAEQP